MPIYHCTRCGRFASLSPGSCWKCGGALTLKPDTVTRAPHVPLPPPQAPSSFVLELRHDLHPDDAALVRTWAALQVRDCGAQFQRVFRERLLREIGRADPLVRQRILSAIFHGLIVILRDVRPEAPIVDRYGRARDVQGAFANDPWGGGYVLLFRFYSGDRETTLPPSRQAPVPGRQRSSQPVRLEAVGASPRDLLRRRVKPASSRERAHAHQEGHQEGSELVSLGCNLPFLLRTFSSKVRIIMFGALGGLGTAGYAQATHLGLFLVPAQRLGPVVWRVGEAASAEREITFQGEDLRTFHLITLLNPFHPGSGYGAQQPPDPG